MTIDKVVTTDTAVTADTVVTTVTAVTTDMVVTTDTTVTTEIVVTTDTTITRNIERVKYHFLCPKSYTLSSVTNCTSTSLPVSGFTEL